MKEKLNDRVLRELTLKQLAVLSAIARTGRISLAAKELGVTPPAVTMQLKLLEDTVGMPLFDRMTEGLRPTDAGAYMLGIEARISASLRECAETLAEFKGVSRGRVRVGIVSTAKYFAPHMLAAFARLHPEVGIELIEGNREATIAALSAFELDVAIMGRPPKSIETIDQPIGDHPNVIVAAPEHPLARRRRLSLYALIDETFLSREAGSGTRDLMERTFLEADVKPKLGMEFSSNETIKQAVMAGLGIAFISGHTVAAEIAAGRLVMLPVAGLPVIRKWHAVRAKGKHPLPAAAAMWTFIAEQAHMFLPRLPGLNDDPPAQ